MDLNFRFLITAKPCISSKTKSLYIANSARNCISSLRSYNARWRVMIYNCFAMDKKTTSRNLSFFGAAARNRTADLILTKDALYRLSHSSVTTELLYHRKTVCQEKFRIFPKNFSKNGKTKKVPHVRSLACVNSLCQMPLAACLFRGFPVQ